MASTLLASRNETYWGERKVYMRKNPNSNPKSNPNPNPNPNPNKQIFASPNQIHGRKTEESTAVEAVSNDSSSLNRKSISLSRKETSNGGYITFNVAAYSRRELKDLKKRLVLELQQVRNLTHRIESGEFQSRSGCGYSASQFSGNYGGREATSNTRSPPPPLHLNFPAVDSGLDGLKDKRTPKANQYYRTSDFVTGKEKLLPPPLSDNKKVSGTKRPFPPATVREPKRLPSDSVPGKMNSGLMKQCSQILTKLMKHKHGWIFNVPVDVVGMELHDYHQIIKRPMDLGSVKLKLAKNLYESPVDFAADVRLTFNNALSYNPKGHDVYMMADVLLNRFEDMFAPLYRKYEAEQRRAVGGGGEVLRNSWSHHQIPSPETKSLDPIRPDHPVHPITAPNPSAEKPAMKQPKPRAKDHPKRDMSFEEKQKLGMNLQSLPQEKMDHVVQIIKRRNSNLAQHGDEIELDIEVVDTDTLWELDRFVSNCKKMMSKIRRQAISANQTVAMGETSNHEPKSPATVAETMEAAAAAKKNKKGEAGDEDVDIGEEMPTTNFPPVEIEKDTGGGSSSSSSSSSDSSSSTDSDSGSSSGSDSDGENDGRGSKASPARS